MPHREFLVPHLISKAGDRRAGLVRWAVVFYAAALVVMERRLEQAADRERETRTRATEQAEVAMHTVKVIAGGFLLLAVCLLIGRLAGGAAPGANLASAAKLFIPLWLVVAAVNMWIGVAKAGYTVADEAPVFLVVFAIPAVVALLLVWRLTRH
jgi:hypothetical protein